MNKIGRKIYYDNATGNILVDTGEMICGVRETTEDEDFNSYLALENKVRSKVGMIKLEYGDLSDKFAKCSGYNIDISKPIIDRTAIVFDFSLQVEDDMRQEKTLQEKVTTLETVVQQQNQAISDLTMMIAIGQTPLP